MTPSVSHAEARAIRRSAPICRRSGEPAGSGLLDTHAREAAFEEEAQHPEELGQATGGVSEADPPTGLDVAVAVDQPVQQPTKVERIATQVGTRQVLLVPFAELGEQSRPLQRVEVDGECPARRLPPHAHPTHGLEAVDELLARPLLVGTEVPAYPADLALTVPVQEGRAVAEERAQDVSKLVGVFDVDAISLELRWTPGELGQVDPQRVG